MSSLKTEQYQLHQWEPGDSVLREEFNENFAKLDVSTRLFFGSYTGDGAAERLISLPITPKAVLVVTHTGDTKSTSGTYGGLALVGAPVKAQYQSHYLPAVEIVEGGFQVGRITEGNVRVDSNVISLEYHYLAFV